MEKGKGFEKYIAMIKFQINRVEKSIQNTSNEARRDMLLERKHRLEYELKTAILGNETYKVLQKIVKNDEEFETLLERKRKGELVDDLINQNRYLAKKLADQDKTLSVKHRKEEEAEKKRTGEEKLQRPVMNAMVSASSSSTKNLQKDEGVMSYDENYVTKYNQKIAQKAIDCVMDGIQLEKPSNYIIKGLNPNEEIAKLEYQKLVKDEKELKKIEREIKFIKNYANNFVKVIFEFDKNLKKLIYMSDIMKTKKSLIPLHIWSGVLNFPITSPVIFGRVCNRKRHKGGKYYFAPFETLKHELIDRLERLQEKIPNFFPYEVIESNLFLDLLRYYKYRQETRENLSQMAKLIKTDNKSIYFVNCLNQQKELIKIMKKIPHFGTIQYGMTKFVSNIDVSTICIPYREVTYFHIDQIAYSPKKHCRSIYSLSNALEALNT